MSPASPPTVLVIGAGGRLGGALVEQLSGRVPVIGLNRGDLNLEDVAAIHRVLTPLAFDRVIVTAAMTAVDACETERDRAHAINARAPEAIAHIAREKGAHLTLIGTDFVFGGDTPGARTENDPVEPRSVYGASKHAGELAVRAASDDFLVVRTSWLYGFDRPAFPEWIIRQAVEKTAVALPEDKVGSPTRAEDLAADLVPLLGLDGAGPAAGIVHLANRGSCTWREWGQTCVDAAVAAGLPVKSRTLGGVPLAEVAAFTAPRPLHSALDTSRYETLCERVPRSWDDALADHLSASPLLRSPAPATF